MHTRDLCRINSWFFGGHTEVNSYTYKSVEMCFMTWNKLETHFQGLLWIFRLFGFSILFTRSPPIHIRFYPSKWHENGSVCKAMMHTIYILMCTHVAQLLAILDMFTIPPPTQPLTVKNTLQTTFNCKRTIPWTQPLIVKEPLHKHQF